LTGFAFNMAGFLDAWRLGWSIWRKNLC